MRIALHLAGIALVRERGRVTGLEVDAGRVTGIAFEKVEN